MTTVRTTYRILLLFSIILICLFPLILHSVLWGRDLRYGLNKRQQVARRMIKFLGFEVQRFGVVPQGNYLYISNHQSYLDPVLVKNWILFQAVAKAEVANWFLIGFVLKCTGTIFVKREDKTSRTDTLVQLRHSLRKEIPVLIFPEGTTTDKNETLPFRMGSFKVASEENVAVVPIAIRYSDRSLAFVGADTFLPHLVHTFSRPKIKVNISFGEPIYHRDPAILMEQTRKCIDEMLLQ
ncbi:MAG: lysophospholipid acyltransferase family protein [Saprospiraceae bacterium]